MNENVAFEPRDLKFKTILLWGAALLATIVFTYLVVWSVYVSTSKRTTRSQPAPSLVRGSQPQLPPEPRLQGAPGHEIHPVDELKQVRSAAETTLNSYGWVNRQAGIARMPIQQAMKIIAAQHFPKLPKIPASGDQGGQPEKIAAKAAQISETAKAVKPGGTAEGSKPAKSAKGKKP